jgi:AbrB family looped-hinge helix DNA binding protein
MAFMNTIITIDKAGRLVVPKAVRDALHLKPGTSLELEQKDDVILLRQPRSEPELVKKDGMWVIRHSHSLRRSIPEFIEQSREERIQDLARPHIRKVQAG